MYIIILMFSLVRILYGEIWFWLFLGVEEYVSMYFFFVEFILCFILGSRGFCYSIDSGVILDFGEVRDIMYDELLFLFWSDIEILFLVFFILLILF